MAPPYSGVPNERRDVLLQAQVLCVSTFDRANEIKTRTVVLLAGSRLFRGRQAGMAQWSRSQGVCTECTPTVASNSRARQPRSRSSSQRSPQNEAARKWKLDERTGIDDDESALKLVADLSLDGGAIRLLPTRQPRN
nr:hypothetical protein CFP56_50857 [Quercus suber]